MPDSEFKLFVFVSLRSKRVLNAPLERRYLLYYRICLAFFFIAFPIIAAWMPNFLYI